MQLISKPVGTREETLGNLLFPVCDNLQEMLDTYGEDVVFNMAGKAISSDYERVGREALKKEGAKEESVQELINKYKPSVRAVKPSLKSFTALAEKFANAQMPDVLMAAYTINAKEGIEAAYNYLEEQARQRGVR